MKLLRFATVLTATAAVNTLSQAPSTELTSLFLEAVLEPLNNSHIKTSIQNTYNKTISILNWNNHFQRKQNGAHGSFKLVRQSPNGSVQILHPAPNRATYRFLKPAPSHFINITEGAISIAILDLSELFEIPRTDDYNLTMDFQTRAILISDDNELPDQIQATGQTAEGLPTLEIRSKQIIMTLDASTPEKALRRRSTLGPCLDDRKLTPLVLKARDNARTLAKYAQNADDSALWAEYFNNSAVELRVKRVYQGIINYGRNGNYYGITEYCDPINEDPECTDDEQVLAYRNPYQAGTNTTTITLCAHFMYLQQQMPCSYPSSTNPSMVDQGGLFLHELTHARSLVGYGDISDGRNASCYSWDCIQQAVAGQNNQIPPWHIGRAYEMYAYAARALGIRSCHINSTLVDNVVYSPSSSPSTQALSDGVQSLPRPPSSVIAPTMLAPAAMPSTAISAPPVVSSASNSMMFPPTAISSQTVSASLQNMAAVQAMNSDNDEEGAEGASGKEVDGGGACVAC